MGFKIKDDCDSNSDNTSLDNKVMFDELSHTYHYENTNLLSTTQFIKQFTKPFNALFPSIAKAKKNIREKTGITDAKTLRKIWKLSGSRASHLGTATHEFAELYVLDPTIKPKTKYEEAIIKAINKLQETWDIIHQELIVYSSEYMIAGSIDLVLRHKKTKAYAIGDWKTTDDMFKYYNIMEEPFKLKDSALNKYSVQLDIYSVLAPYYIPETNRIVIRVDYNGNYEFFTPLSKKKNKLPFTLDKTMIALNEYKKINIKLN